MLMEKMIYLSPNNSICIHSLRLQQVMCTVNDMLIDMGSDVSDKMFCQTSEHLCYASKADPTTHNCIATADQSTILETHT